MPPPFTCVRAAPFCCAASLVVLWGCSRLTAWSLRIPPLKRAKSMPTIICAGLGPGAWEHVTLEVKALLDTARTIYLRTRTHPTADHLPGHLDVRTFDYLYEREARFEEIYRQIAEELISLAQQSSDP